MYSKIEIEDNRFSLLISNSKYPIWVKCLNISNEEFFITRYLDDKLKEDVIKTLNKICKILSGKESIRLLKYKKYNFIYKSIEDKLNR